jgi:hypothetical protein
MISLQNENVNFVVVLLFKRCLANEEEEEVQTLFIPVLSTAQCQMTGPE